MIATEKDLPAIVDMARKFHDAEQLPYKLDIGSISDTIAGLIQHGFVAVSKRGFIAGIAQPSPLNSKWLLASEFLWWSEDNDGMKLLKEFKDWAVSIGANEIRYSCPAHNDRVQKIFARTGDANEIVYSEIVPCV